MTSERALSREPALLRCHMRACTCVCIPGIMSVGWRVRRGAIGTKTCVASCFCRHLSFLSLRRTVLGGRCGLGCTSSARRARLASMLHGCLLLEAVRLQMARALAERALLLLRHRRQGGGLGRRGEGLGRREGVGSDGISKPVRLLVPKGLLQCSAVQLLEEEEARSERRRILVGERRLEPWR